MSIRTTGKWRWEYIGELCVAHNLRRGAELGVKEGRFTSYLMAHIPDMSMVCVDLWDSSVDTGDLEEEGGETYDQFPMEHFYQRFARTMDGLPVTIHRMRTTDAAPLVEDGSLDFVFIDADHTEPAVRADINAWRQKIRPGGLLCGHDIDQPQVRRAVAGEVGTFEEGPNKVWLKWM